jgi:amino acid transporter
LFILLAYMILSVLVLFIVTAITEVSAYLPVSGGTMSYYGHRNVSNSLGFAMGWLYWYSLGILVPYEITAAGLVIGYWNSPVNIAVWITIFIVVIVGLNILPVQFYGETEFWFASLKVFMMIGLLILSFILFWGGGRKSIVQFMFLNLTSSQHGNMAFWASTIGKTLVQQTPGFALGPRVVSSLSSRS